MPYAGEDNYKGVKAQVALINSITTFITTRTPALPVMGGGDETGVEGLEPP